MVKSLVTTLDGDFIVVKHDKMNQKTERYSQPVSRHPQSVVGINIPVYGLFFIGVFFSIIIHLPVADQV